MKQLIHFAKVFGIAWAIITATYIVVITRWGFGIGWLGSSPPPMWLLRVMFYVWPVIPAFFVAAIWELARVAMVRKN